MRYAGIERLAFYWACELHRRSHQVTVAAARGSSFPQSIRYIEVPRGDFVQGELIAYGVYRRELIGQDIILDFSHSHWPMRDQSLPAMCWCWHTPATAQPPLPGYNVLALSEFQQQQLFQYQKVQAQVLDCHCVVPGPVEALPIATPTPPFVFIGRATPTKGMLQAAQLCCELVRPLHIIGGLGPGDDQGYLEQVKALCSDALGIIYWGEVSDPVKNALVKQSEALIYPINYPGQAGEAHSHKSVDSLCLGTPVIAYAHGALPEVIEHGVNGFLARTPEEFKDYMGKAGELDRTAIQQRALDRWAMDMVVGRASSAMEQVAGGARW